MYRIKEDCQSEIIIKKSRFLTYLHTVNNEDDAKAYIQTIRKEHPNATHHCYAFLIGEHNEIQRSNDDKEPSGTAGMPMLECLLHNQMQDILAVTVRYFGGIKLGAGGLIRAYAGSVSQALKTAVRTRKQKMQKCMLHFSYDLIGKLDHYFRSEQMEVLTKEYAEMVTYTFLCVSVPSDAILQLTSGQYAPQLIEEVIMEVPLIETNS